MIKSKNIELNNDNDVKIYELKRYKPCNSHAISIFILNNKEDKLIADKIKREIHEYNSSMEIKMDISEFASCYDDKIIIFNEVMYMVILVSEKFLKDWYSMNILLDNYNLKGNNRKILPLIIDDSLYEPVKRSEIIKYLQEYSVNFAKKYYIDEYNDDIPIELEKMQRVIKMVKDLIKLSLKRDKKSSISLCKKIIKYIEAESGITINESVQERESYMNNKITNNFYGTIGHLQLQQANKNALQSEMFGQPDFDYESVQKVIEEISKNNSKLDDIYGDNIAIIRKLLSDITYMLENREEPKKIKDALSTLKELTVGISGSLIASGIVSMISNLNI